MTRVGWLINDYTVIIRLKTVLLRRFRSPAGKKDLKVLGKKVWLFQVWLARRSLVSRWRFILCSRLFALTEGRLFWNCARRGCRGVRFPSQSQLYKGTWLFNLYLALGYATGVNFLETCLEPHSCAKIAQFTHNYYSRVAKWPNAKLFTHRGKI